MNCDPIARAYRWIEYLAFGRTLERTRFRYLSEVASARRALILGDGDGRFLGRFVAVSQASAECVDSSARMLELRPIPRGNRPRELHACRRAYRAPRAGRYDLIVTHFFLDCFDADLNRLIDRVTCAAQRAMWLISEFREPAWARPLLAAMYLFFA